MCPAASGARRRGGYAPLAGHARITAARRRTARGTKKAALFARPCVLLENRLVLEDRQLFEINQIFARRSRPLREARRPCWRRCSPSSRAPLRANAASRRSRRRRPRRRRACRRASQRPISSMTIICFLRGRYRLRLLYNRVLHVGLDRLARDDVVDAHARRYRVRQRGCP